jgi:tetratricopeptide (TPR) repeat protein
MQAAEKLVARGKISQAIREYRKLLRQNPNDANMLNRVGDLYARQDRVDDAVELFRKIAESYSRDGFFVKAIAIYKKILRLDPTQLEVYEKLAELYHRQGLISEARSQYLVLVDYYTKHRNTAATIEIHRKMADLEPNDPSPRVRLAELYLREGLIEETIGEYQRIAELMLDHGRVEEATKVYLRALEVDSEDLAFVSEAVMRLHEEAEPEAAERVLSAAVALNPEAARLAQRMRDHAAEAAAREALDVDEATDEKPGERRPAAAAVAPSDSVDVADLLDGAQEIESIEEGVDGAFVIGLEEEDTAATVDELTARALRGQAGAAEAVDEELEIDLAQLEESATGAAAAPPGKRGGVSSVEALAESLGLSTAATRAPRPAGSRAAPPATAADTARSELSELLAEAEVFAKYGLETKALRRLEQAVEIDPASFEVRRRLVMLHLKRGAEGDVIDTAQRLLDLEEVAGGSSWEDVLGALSAAGYVVEGGRVRRAASAAAPAVPPEPQAATAQPAIDDEKGLEWLDSATAEAQTPEELFEIEEEFFDLAAEIEKELARESAGRSRELTDVGRGGDESLEEIVQGFKQGVADVLSPDAYETHYNLGIAYREMGLVDEAIGEFQLCAKDPDHLVDSCSMLGACFQEKGFPDLAVKWYKRGLDAPMISEEESLSLLYDLGSVYAVAGEREAAYEVFVEIYGVNSHYRDVVARLEELRG